MTGAPNGWWPRQARFVTQRPGAAMLLALAILAPLIAVVPSMRLVDDVLADLPAGTASVEGFRAMERHFPAGDLSPILLVIDSDHDVTEPASFRALGDLSRNLKRLDAVASVRSVAMPTDGQAPDLQAAGFDSTDDVASQVGDFEGQLEAAANGAERLANGIAQVDDGVAQIDAELPQLVTGLGAAAEGADQLADGVPRLREGLASLDAGLRQLDTGLEQVEAGARALADGLTEARDGAATLRDEVAVPAEAAIREAFRILTREFTIGLLDPAYLRAVQQVGETYGRLTGEDPRTGQQVEPGYEGLTAALDELAGGLSEARTGAHELAQGASQLRQGLARARDGVVQLDDGLALLEAGSSELAEGLAQAPTGARELQDGIGQLKDGTGQLRAGAAELAQGLRAGVVQLESAGFDELLAGMTGNQQAGPFVLSPAMLEFPGVRDQLGLFLTEDRTRTRLLISPVASPFGPEAQAAVREITAVAEYSLQGTPLAEATVLPAGTSAFLGAIDEAASRDLVLIIVAVLLGVFTVLVILLRALVAPAYMVLTTLASYGAALGLATILFQWILGDDGLVWYLPPFLFVILVGAGADYAIYLIARIREEAEHRPTREAVERATAATGSVIASAGLILAGTFSALMAADLRPLVQMGFAIAAGILIDTLVVRTILGPAIATALGRVNWWPSARGRNGVRGGELRKADAHAGL